MNNDFPIFYTIPEKLLNGKEEVDTLAVLDPSDIVCFYFSAHWCPPCRNFTPILAGYYSNWKKNGLNVEIIFVSSDSDNKSFQEYYATMPWLAINKTNVDAIEYLNDVYQISGIPSLIVLDRMGNVIDKNGRDTVVNEKEGSVEKWYSMIK